MQSEWKSLTTSRWMKIALGAVFVLGNAVLYFNSRHFITEILLSHSPMLSANFTKDNFTHHSSLDKMFYQSSSVFTTEMAFLREPVVNPHDFKYLIQPKVTCANEDVILVMCVPIAYNNYEGRSVIRKTWGSYAYNMSNKARLVFFIGNIPPESGKSAAFTQRNISAESLQYGDILQEDYVDSYRNLSLKSVSILKWVHLFCSFTKFVLKVDDDIYINIPFLVNVLHEYSSHKSSPKSYVIGSLQVNAHPKRDSNSKWYTPTSMFPGNTYPNYAIGPAYAMTGIAASLLYEASLRVPTFWLEDIYITGLCAKTASVKLYESGYFTFEKRAVSGCSFKSNISGHQYKHQEILQIHKQLNDPNLKC
ncbi:unnamed protein product [Candidula unifasciata]|uniref:Hexosyltransferase n=1 Tax=Candidula unifasciata TaxID=100452 RepID=A0A8S3ZHB3_9EUPU|nr:unnamed protein product [Candidula unifasciata]